MLPRYALSVATVTLLAVACGGEEAVEQPEVVRPVSTTQVGFGAGGSLTFPGTLQGSDRADLSFRVGGPLIQFPVAEGDEVRAGQLLAQIDPRDYTIAVAEAQASYEQAEADLERFQRLYEREAVPLAELQLRRAQRDVARSRYDQAQADLRDTNLRAPFDGWVGRRFVENFEDVQPREVILSLQNIDPVEIVIDVPEYLIAVMGGREFQKIARFSIAPGLEYPLDVKEFSAEADPRTRTFQITFTMRQPDEFNALPGMTATVVGTGNAELMRSDATFPIPSSAVFGGDSGGSYVWVVDPANNTVHRREVEMGQVTGEDQVLILDGLDPGERVAVAAIHQLTEGQEIRPLESR